MGSTNADNKFGISPYIVGQILGDGCNYSSIQSAIDDAFAAGGGTVGIRPSNTPYVENLTFRHNVQLIGLATDGRLPNPLGQVSLTGVHTFTSIAAFELFAFRDIAMNSGGGGDLITINATGANSMVMVCKECSIIASGPGERCFVLNADAAASIQIATDVCSCNAQGHCVDNIGLGQGGVSFSGTGGGASSLGNGFNTGAGVLSFSVLNGASLSGSGYAVFSGGGQLSGQLQYADINATTNEGISFGAGGGQVSLRHMIVASSAASGFWITGTGNLAMADVICTNSATGIDPAVTVTNNNWQPYGTAGTSMTAYRGALALDSTQFSVTDGFAQLIAGSGSLTWFDRAVSIAVAGFTGNAVTSTSVTLTLPTTPANGTECDFLALGANVFSIRAGGADVLRLGNSTSPGGGSLTSSSLGDSIRLVYMTSSTTWCSIGGAQGNWTVGA